MNASASLFLVFHIVAWIPSHASHNFISHSFSWWLYFGWQIYLRFISWLSSLCLCYHILYKISYVELLWSLRRKCLIDIFAIIPYISKHNPSCFLLFIQFSKTWCAMNYYNNKALDMAGEFRIIELELTWCWWTNVNILFLVVFYHRSK
jgi:hypothetical protein